MITALNASGTAGLSTTPQPAVLSYADAATVWLLSWTGNDETVIAAKMGTNIGRVADILAENTYVGSRDNAARMRNARAAMLQR
ncbi:MULTISPECIES: hypothetical protein [Roseobacteraceae]|jgi:hypothetical protein|uniref:Uncharacterized protein n=1 Tax=Pseudosulfitobacter pseudonitzschiae TaxID=1402135 RepID=A0A221K4S6_9RHOB|nr:MULTISPECIES: hypothetical protein [Roseobacteraceae]ASM73847.1 hypothetical protein SULPSESMR1_03069 [Pseudosulfitobacter pseudonitzschiae]